MISTVLHWLNVEYWTASWPNVFAPSFWTLLGIAYSHHKIKEHQRMLMRGDVK